ncbi:unnamed protein product [Prorocentrum cordatum]|uniref:Uncharacterized protein n=1 Tax=Prorocentrum cordatum TaxID=2364126 RepID=A0ABN9XF83_9DINO|nr:unnamed protein product [Polarella glacialis]
MSEAMRHPAGVATISKNRSPICPGPMLSCSRLRLVHDAPATSLVRHPYAVFFPASEAEAPCKSLGIMALAEEEKEEESPSCVEGPPLGCARASFLLCRLEP